MLGRDSLTVNRTKSHRINQGLPRQVVSTVAGISGWRLRKPSPLKRRATNSSWIFGRSLPD